MVYCLMPVLPCPGLPSNSLLHGIVIDGEHTPNLGAGFDRLSMLLLNHKLCVPEQVFVAGSEVTAEHRVQLYTPAYLQNGKSRPVITSVSTTNITYGQNITVGFSTVTSIDRVVLNRYTGATHGNHFDQRQVVLDFAVFHNSVTCTTPLNSAVAPPGQYMLFVLYQGVPSVASIVSLQLPPSSGTPSVSSSGK